MSRDLRTKFKAARFNLTMNGTNLGWIKRLVSNLHLLMGTTTKTLKSIPIVGVKHMIKLKKILPVNKEKNASNRKRTQGFPYISNKEL